MNWYLEVFKKYATFSGRARRSEYWFFYLFTSLAMILLFLADMALGTVIDPESPVGILSLLYFLATFLPNLAVTVRRLHDIGRSGWWILIGFIPFGSLVLFVFSVLDSVPDNQWGSNPKGFSLPTSARTL